jgi:hypothetical protein
MSALSGLCAPVGNRFSGESPARRGLAKIMGCKSFPEQPFTCIEAHHLPPRFLHLPISGIELEETTAGRGLVGCRTVEDPWEKFLNLRNRTLTRRHPARSRCIRRGREENPTEEGTRRDLRLPSAVVARCEINYACHRRAAAACKCHIALIHGFGIVKEARPWDEKAVVGRARVRLAER